MSRNRSEKFTKSDDFLYFGKCVFDLGRNEFRSPDGVPIPLRDQAGKVLAVLAQNPNLIVGKDELIEKVWGSTFVTDDSLVQCIVDIRRALGETAHEIIETFPKKGYRLNAPMHRENTIDEPTRPAIAVLPFVNLSGDPDQEYFADGMTEDIITGLSRFRSLFVIARNSTFAYKGKSPDVREVAQQVGARYILEGSVRQVGSTVRITGQLVDATKGNHLWAENYDRAMENIFAVQDEITDKIVAAVAPEIDLLERQNARRVPPGNLDVWGLFQRGITSHMSAMGDECLSVIEQFDKVCELDPTFAPGFAMAATARVRYALLFEPGNREKLLEQALVKAREGITLDIRDSTCLWAYGRVLTMLGNFNAAISSLEDAIEINPNDSLAHYYLAMALGSAGQLEEAISRVDIALKLNPRDVAGGGFRIYKAFVLFDLELYEEALICAQHAIREPFPLSICFEVVTAALVKLKRPNKARIALRELVEHTPGVSLSRVDRRLWIGRPETKARYLSALREAGLPK